MPAPRRLVTGIAVAVLLAGSALAAAAPAGATALPIQQCTTSSGAVLAVDFGHWGGPVLRACGSTPTTGYTLLNQGGWRSTGTRTGPGFICRISFSGYQGGAAFPSTSEQGCVNTPPTTAYWSYWHANVGDSSWTYSQDGAANYAPKPGSVDLWTFGGSSTSPRVSPDAVRAHNSSPGAPNSAPAPHSSAPAAGSSSPVAGGGTSGGGSGGGGAAAGRPAFGPALSTAGGRTGTGAGRNHAASRSAASTAGRAASTAPSPATTGASAAGTPAIVNAPPTAAASHSSGSAVPGLVTAGLVFALGSIAAWAGWRRRLGR